MEGCSNCLQSPEGIIRQLESVKKQAAKYVQKEKTSVAIYREGFEFRFCELRNAIAGSYPIAEVISFNPTASPG